MTEKVFGEKKKETTVNNDDLQLSRDGTQSARIVLREKGKQNIEDIQRGLARARETISDSFVKPHFEFFIIYLHVDSRNSLNRQTRSDFQQNELINDSDEQNHNGCSVLCYRTIFFFRLKHQQCYNCPRGRKSKFEELTKLVLLDQQTEKIKQGCTNNTRESRNYNQLSKHDNTI